MAGHLIAMPRPPAHTMGGVEVDAIVAAGRNAQQQWSAVPLADRLRVVRATRHAIAAHAEELAGVIPSGPARSIADSLVAEVLPLAEACRFLEREAAFLLRPTRLGSRGRPAWLRGVEAEVHRVPLGLVLIVAPSNYPLFLPAVQALQAIAAGNAVLWKPAPGGDNAARALARILFAAGLPEHVLQVLETDAQAGLEAIHAGVDKVFLTGHADTGRAVLHHLADALTPSVMELSGCDAVFLLPGADLDRAAEALAFGLRLNGSATCMAPRRVYASAADVDRLLPKLLSIVDRETPIPLSPKVRSLLDGLIADAERRGAAIVRDGRALHVTATVIKDATPDCAVLRTDIFAPILAFCPVPDEAGALRAYAECPYGLTAAVFGPALPASRFAQRICAGTVLINDLIVATADPRVSFGGRGQSGFGVTRGREGLLEMTTVKTLLHQKSRSLRPYARTGPRHQEFFSSFIQAMHAGPFTDRLRGFRRLLTAAQNLEIRRTPEKK